MDETTWLVVGVVSSLVWAGAVVRVMLGKEKLDTPLKSSYRLFRRKGKQNGDQ